MSVHKYATVEIDCDNRSCTACWRQDFIQSVRVADAIRMARADGWEIGRDGKVLCPQCKKIGRGNLKL